MNGRPIEKKEGKIEEIERIEELIAKDKIKSVPGINYVFRLWLKNYFNVDQIKVEENIKSGIKPSITVLESDQSVFIAWQNVDPQTVLLLEEEREKIKAVALHVYSKVLFPDLLFLSNGHSIYVYNKKLKEILQIKSLKEIDKEKEEKLISLLEK